MTKNPPPLSMCSTVIKRRTVQVLGFIALIICTLILQSLGTFHALRHGKDRKVPDEFRGDLQYCEYVAFNLARLEIFSSFP